VSQTRTRGEEAELAEVAAPALLGEISLLTELPARASVKIFYLYYEGHLFIFFFQCL